MLFEQPRFSFALKRSRSLCLWCTAGTCRRNDIALSFLFNRSICPLTAAARGTDRFLEQSRLPRGGRSLLPRTAPKALNLMDDWCGTTVRHRAIETGRVNQGSHISRGLKEEIRKFLTETSVPLDLPVNGRARPLLEVSFYLMNQTSSSRTRPAIRNATPSTETLPRTRLQIKKSTPAARAPYATKLVHSNHATVSQYIAGHLLRATKL